MEKRKICVITGTRAEYGLLKPVIKGIEKEEDFELLLYVTGAHLSPEFGFTYREIEKDDINISRKIEMLLSADTASGVLKSMGVEMLGFADAFAEDKPDMVVLLGDRYEILVAAVAAMMFNIPIAHIHGGELTEGAMDDAIRHAISKMSYLHFAATEEYKRRIIQMGEEPNRVYNVGALGIENIKSLKLLSKEELERELGFLFKEQTAIVTFHPETMESTTSEEHFFVLSKALERFPDLKLIFTKANADMDGRVINMLIEKFVQQNEKRSICFDSLGQLRYLSALQFCDIVIGNSSSGIIEVPSFHIATVNVGNRQKGRVRARSVIDCEMTIDGITDAIRVGLSREFRHEILKDVNPYEGRDTSRKIIEKIKDFFEENDSITKVKKFYDI